jgi:DNA-binding transcriptional MerR regulator
MRMREVARATGLSPSTIHFYLREGLVPPPEKPTRNSARYSPLHVGRLKLIRDLRAQEPQLPLAAVRRILELVDQGVEAPVAIALQRSVSRGLTGDDPATARARDSDELAAASGLSPKKIEELLHAGVIVPSPGADPPFDGADLSIAKHLGVLLGHIPVDVEELAEIANHLRAASELEMRLRNRAVRSLDAAGSAQLSGQMQEWANLWHAYLFSRARQHEIAIHGLGTDDGPPQLRDGLDSEEEKP